MRVTSMRSRVVAGESRTGLRQPRQGVVLMIVIGMLTLFEIVGISFVSYADSAKQGVTQFRESTFVLREETVGVAPLLGRDLQRALRERVDFGPQVESLEELAAHVQCLKAKVEEASDRERDPEARRNQNALIVDLEQYEAAIEDLLWILEQIRLGR